MILRMFLTILAVILLMPGASRVLAQSGDSQPEKAPSASSAPAPESADPVIDNPYLARLQKKSGELVDQLGEEELKHLYHVRETFGSTRAVKIVRRDVSDAVKACGKANPDMKQAMDDRFAVWTGAVDPAIAEKEAQIDEAIKQQDYAKPKDIKDYLKLIEQSAEHANKAIDKQIMTSPEDCQSLLDSMDRTQDVVKTLIGKMTLSPWPPVIEEKPEIKTTTPN